MPQTKGIKWERASWKYEISRETGHQEKRKTDNRELANKWKMTNRGNGQTGRCNNLNKWKKNEKNTIRMK